MSKKRPKIILQDHFRKNSVFYPRFTYDGPKQRFQNIDWRGDIVPEILWIALIIDKVGYSRGIEITSHLAILASQIATHKQTLDFGICSSYGVLSKDEKKVILDQVRNYGLSDILSASLSPLGRLYKKFPLSFLCLERSVANENEAVDQIKSILLKMLYRHDRVPTLAQGAYYEAIVNSGKLRFVKGIEKYDSSVLEGYPNTKESQEVAGFIRCTVTGIPMEAKISNVPERPDWSRDFWATSQLIGDCEPEEKEGIYPNQISQIFLLYVNQEVGVFCARMNVHWSRVSKEFPLDLKNQVRREVLLGLACRIYRLTVQCASFPPNWSEDIGQIYLRMCTESLIYFSWLNEKGDDSNFNDFYEHGLGNQKLKMEHLNSYFQENGLSQEDADSINDGFNYLRKHKLPDFIPVNLGNPLKKDLRKLASEAGLKEIYSMIYSPTSSAIHGSYDNLDEHYLRQCMNPFHCLHRIPYHWYKTPFSFYGLANCLHSLDFVMVKLFAMVDPDEDIGTPGADLFEALLDEEKFQEFSDSEENREDAEIFEERIRKKKETAEQKYSEELESS